MIRAGALIVALSLVAGGLYLSYRGLVSVGKAEVLECLLKKKGQYFNSLDPCLWEDE